MEMSVFSRECDQREQCAQPLDTNGPPYHLSRAALDQRHHSLQGTVTSEHSPVVSRSLFTHSPRGLTH